MELSEARAIRCTQAIQCRCAIWIAHLSFFLSYLLLLLLRLGLTAGWPQTFRDLPASDPSPQCWDSKACDTRPGFSSACFCEWLLVLCIIEANCLLLCRVLINGECSGMSQTGVLPIPASLVLGTSPQATVPSSSCV